MGLYETQRRSEGKCRSRAGKGEMPPVWAAASPADPGRTDGGVERERPSWDPKDGELCLKRLKPEETLVEDRSDSDVQIDRQIWV